MLSGVVGNQFGALHLGDWVWVARAVGALSGIAAIVSSNEGWWTLTRRRGASAGGLARERTSNRENRSVAFTASAFVERTLTFSKRRWRLFASIAAAVLVGYGAGKLAPRYWYSANG